MQRPEPKAHIEDKSAFEYSDVSKVSFVPVLSFVLNTDFSQCEGEWQLLEDSDSLGSGDDNDSSEVIPTHDILTAPLMTREAYLSVRSDKRMGQYGVIGKVLGIQCVVSTLVDSNRPNDLLQSKRTS